MTTDWTQPEPATHSVPDLDLGALERAARAATPGEWVHVRASSPRGAALVHGPERTPVAICQGAAPGMRDFDAPSQAFRDANAAHIAAWSPATALRVLGELRAARDAAADAVEGR